MLRDQLEKSRAETDAALDNLTKRHVDQLSRYLQECCATQKRCDTLQQQYTELQQRCDTLQARLHESEDTRLHETGALRDTVLMLRRQLADAEMREKRAHDINLMLRLQLTDLEMHVQTEQERRSVSDAAAAATATAAQPPATPAHHNADAPSTVAHDAANPDNQLAP